MIEVYSNKMLLAKKYFQILVKAKTVGDNFK